MAGISSKRCTSDRLSTLPDAVLHSIMSFLTSRLAVQTSMLSPRWRDLWRSAPCLDIDSREFDGGNTAVNAYEADDKAWAKLEEFTYNVLMDHRPLRSGAREIPAARRHEASRRGRRQVDPPQDQVSPSRARDQFGKHKQPAQAASSGTCDLLPPEKVVPLRRELGRWLR
ncbi:hypothetical protein EJB05_37834, partial [Eragrostis curvula]